MAYQTTGCAHLPVSLSSLTYWLERRCYLVPDDGLEALAGLTALTNLNNYLRECGQVSDGGCQTLASLIPALWGK
jgi:hypothetical protein